MQLCLPQITYKSMPTFSLCPTALVSFCRSLPARSTRFNCEVLTFWTPSFVSWKTLKNIKLYSHTTGVRNLLSIWKYHGPSQNRVQMTIREYIAGVASKTQNLGRCSQGSTVLLGLQNQKSRVNWKGRFFEINSGLNSKRPTWIEDPVATLSIPVH